ncbi:hypothetical protein LOK49_LG01G04019 [Camellia lanceoleosa]|uniref:Uncharacterized protein n=1 Tax=Camellia lanceoleosa TaxID=1840588 RepID=A0ACC0IZU7_9ERIC|nr:hypothetical protein LOK49_LG01G04019 [Camellia lanceoleosa]
MNSAALGFLPCKRRHGSNEGSNASSLTIMAAAALGYKVWVASEFVLQIGILIISREECVLPLVFCLFFPTFSALGLVWFGWAAVLFIWADLGCCVVDMLLSRVVLLM